MSKVVLIVAKGQKVVVKGDNNVDIASALTSFTGNHFAPYGVKKSSTELEEHPSFTVDHSAGIWSEDGTRLN